MLKFVFISLIAIYNCAAIDLKNYENRVPQNRGMDIKGVIKRVDSKAVFLTFDFCQTGFDKRIFDFLTKNNIPATFFITKIWIDNNPEIAKMIAKSPLISIQNHGTKHLPCFLKETSVYGIKSTRNSQEIINEIEQGGNEILRLTSKKPTFYRSGTAHYDDICIEIASNLGYKIAGFAINGDGGAQYAADKVYNEVIKAKPGDIILLHGNKPKSGTYDGIVNAINEMRKNNVQFEKIS